MKKRCEICDAEYMTNNSVAKYCHQCRLDMRYLDVAFRYVHQRYYKPNQD